MELGKYVMRVVKTVCRRKTYSTQQNPPSQATILAAQLVTYPLPLKEHDIS